MTAVDDDDGARGSVEGLAAAIALRVTVTGGTYVALADILTQSNRGSAYVLTVTSSVISVTCQYTLVDVKSAADCMANSRAGRSIEVSPIKLGRSPPKRKTLDLS